MTCPREFVSIALFLSSWRLSANDERHRHIAYGSAQDIFDEFRRLVIGWQSERVAVVRQLIGNFVHAKAPVDYIFSDLFDLFRVLDVELDSRIVELNVREFIAEPFLAEG